MKKFIIIVPLLTLLVVVARADEAAVNVEKKEIVTGSNIPRVVHRVGNTVDTVAPVFIIDRKDINRSGGGTVGQVLRRVPFVTLAGH